MTPKVSLPGIRRQQGTISRARVSGVALTRTPSTLPELSFPVVAIGASAGGLSPFRSLLKGLPSNTGMAFVLIQHLETTHKRALSALLSKTTKMPLVEASNGLTVEKNHVYVIPPNRTMSIRGGALLLTPKTGDVTKRSIDRFCLALAEDRGASAVGVILSGTGSDGTDGLKAIKAAGGVTFAQDPATADWPPMPLSAIAAGTADFILSPRRIAAELVRIAAGPRMESAENSEGSDLNRIQRLLQAAAGIDFQLYKQSTVRRRVVRRMALQKISSLTKYAQVLKENPAEAHALADDIFIRVTSFFRDTDSFQTLRRAVLSKLGLNRGPDEPIRIWVAGCSTGQEVYSIAIMLLEALGTGAIRVKVQIFGTDIQERAVELARAGSYTKAEVSGISAVRLKRFFVKDERGYQVQKFVRDLCMFARHDLGKDPPFSRIDLISCRNVLIYMGAALQSRTLAALQYALRPGGHLFLGAAESISEYSDAFAQVDRKHKIFQRNPSSSVVRSLPFSEPPTHGIGHSFAKHTETSVTESDVKQQGESILLRDYAPPALIVDADLRVVHFQGDTSPYVTPTQSHSSVHLLKILRPEFLPEVQTAIRKAKKSGGPVSAGPVQFERHGQFAKVVIDVKPLSLRDGGKSAWLVVFRTPAIDSVMPSDADSGTDSELPTDRAKRPPLSAREQVRDQKRQTANEELETAKEELQSANQELFTLNEELQSRSADLAVITHDLDNLLEGVDLAVVVLDAGFRVRRYTPVAGKVLNLIGSDLGRPFSHVASVLSVANWEELFSEVAKNRESIEREVTDRNGQWFSLRVRPYTRGSNAIAGVLLVLFDIDTMKRVASAADEACNIAIAAQHRTERILNSLPACVVVIDEEGDILTTNEAWNNLAVANAAPQLGTGARGMNYLEICRRSADTANAEARLALSGIESVLHGKSSFQFEYVCSSMDIRRWFSMTVAPLRGERGGAVITHVEITESKHAELALRKSESTIRALLESTTQSIIVVDEKGRIVLANKATEGTFGWSRGELAGLSLNAMIPAGVRARHGEHFKAYFSDLQSRPMGKGAELMARRKDGSVFPVEIGLGAIEMDSARLAVAFITDITFRREMERATREHAEEVQSLATGLLSAQEDERARVSRELHDQICQQLAALAMEIGPPIDAPVTPAETRSVLRRLQQQVLHAAETARHIAYQLHPSVLADLGLEASLRALCTEFCNREGIGVEMKMRGLPRMLSAEIASCIYRVAQESLQNIAKHSGAERVKVSVEMKSGLLRLGVRDSGRGFDMMAIKGRRGLGLIGMQERVKLVRGKFSIVSRAGKGTSVTAEIPVPEEYVQ